MPITKLTRNDLRRAVVRTLEERPNNSCVKDKLPNLVCRHLKIEIRGKARNRLKKEIGIIVGALKRANIIDEYKAKNKRYRLDSDYKDKFSRLLNRGSGEEICFDESGGPDNSDNDIRTQLTGDTEPPLEITSFPNLPEITDSPLFLEDEEDDEDLDYDHETESEPIDPELLGVLRGADDPINETETGNSSSSIETANTNDKIFSLIESFASGRPHLSCEVRINQVQLTLTFDGSVTLILFSYNRRTELATFQVLLPDLTLASEKILIESGSDQFTCIPCLVRVTGRMEFRLRRTIPLTSEPERCVSDALDEVINDTIRIIDLAKLETS